MLAFVDRLSDLCGRLAAWLFVLIGAMIVYEVVARYIFLAPTIWAEEMSRFVQVWATCLGAAWVLRHRHLIRIHAVTNRLGRGARFACDAASLFAVAAFSAVAVVKGIGIAHESFVQGRASATMLEVPLWMSEIAVPLGFAILLLQTLAEAARLALRRDAAIDAAGDR